MKVLPLLSLIASLALMASSLISQNCPTYDLTEAWVDPVFGADATGAVGDPARPFMTIATASAALASSMGPDGGIVRCLPGLYGNVPCANSEPLPVLMVDGVHIQGAGAKECVIRGDGTSDNVFAFYPTTFSGTRLLVEALVDFSLVNNFFPDEPSIDGFTFQGGDVQVYVESEYPARGRVSNCVFDMRKGGKENLLGPSFGTLMVSVYFGEPNPYNDMRMNLINNTFIQGRQRTDGANETAIPDNVAICDVNDPAPFWGSDSDPNPTLRGVGQPNIQNNVIRSLPSAPRTALLGISSDDVSAIVGTFSGLTNAFNSSLVGGINVTGTFTSAIVTATPPLPRVELNLALGGSDPGFVGEMIESTLSATNPEVRDWRILPDSNLVDGGAAPIYNIGTCDGTLMAPNGTALVDHLLWPASAFDFDGEVYGNPRTNSFPDIGFDESDLLMIAGSYGNDSKSHHLPMFTWGGGSCSATAGSPRRVLVFPSAVVGAGTLYATLAPWASLPAWTNMPGSLNPALGLAVGDLWLDVFSYPLRNFGTLIPAPTLWTNPVDGVMHSFKQLTIDYDETLFSLPPLFLNEQMRLKVSNGPVISNRLSNLQSEYL